MESDYFSLMYWGEIFSVHPFYFPWSKMQLRYYLHQADESLETIINNFKVSKNSLLWKMIENPGEKEEEYYLMLRLWCSVFYGKQFDIEWYLIQKWY